MEPKILPPRPTAARVPGKDSAAESPPERRGLASLSAIREWLLTSGNYYLASTLIHMSLLLVLALALGVRYVAQTIGSAPAFDAVELVRIEPQINQAPDMLERISLDVEGEANLRNMAPLPPGALQPGMSQPGADKLFDSQPGGIQSAALIGGGTPEGDDTSAQWASTAYQLSGAGYGPSVKGLDSLRQGRGTGRLPGSGGPGEGFRQRGSGNGPVGSGITPYCRSAVSEALDWLARHQNADGSWSLGKFSAHCHGGQCDGPGSVQSDAAATALGVLPFLARGETHVGTGKYKVPVRAALNWLVIHQASTGDLSAGSTQVMYSHALATIALCEAYGMAQSDARTKNYDSRLRRAAEAAVRFIEESQNSQDGGWRYHPAEGGDTSVAGWQVMALKSAQMAGLPVRQAALDGARKWLDATAGGQYGGQFSYQPGRTNTKVMSSVGLLCRQYLGAARQDPGLNEGVRLLSAHLPDAQRERNVYYWYYATQVMHNLMDDNWDTWNRQMRRTLIETQAKEGCAKGSWDPARPTADAWGAQGGRLMVTSLSCLTLEVYYRYLPLYDLEHSKQGEKRINIDSR